MELTYPWGLIYLIILFFFALLSAGLAAKVTVQKQEIKDLLGRRDKKDKPKQHREQAKDEYIKLLNDNNKELEQQVTDTQLALCEVYELIGG